MATEGVSAGTQAVLGAFGMHPCAWQFGMQKVATAAASPHVCRVKLAFQAIQPTSLVAFAAGLSFGAVVLYVAWLVVRAVAGLLSNRCVVCTSLHSMNSLCMAKE
jgi:hypothetical protein